MAEALRAAVTRLAGRPDAAREARLILAHATGIAPDRVTLHLSDPVGAAAMARLDQALSARLAHQPVAQITGRRDFWGRTFRVTRDVLDPRAETETLVAQALLAPFYRVLDLGTGSGCILISLLADRPAAHGLGVDLSPAALAVAGDNAALHGVTKRCDLRVSDWFSAVDGRFDLIVSNPPYIAASEMASLSPDVRDWEPHLALTPGGDGLGAYRAIAREARAHLVPGGRLIVEIGPTQGRAVAALMVAGGLQDPVIVPDLDGRDRVVAARAP